VRAHYHTGIEMLVIGAIGTALVFHGFRFVAARLVDQPGVVGKFGEALGGAFTFGGTH
jgi:hypothetical protein